MTSLLGSIQSRAELIYYTLCLYLFTFEFNSDLTIQGSYVFSGHLIKAPFV